MRHLLGMTLLCVAFWAAGADEADPEEPAKPSSSIRYTFPRDADAEALVDFCLELEYYEPETDAEAESHDKRMPKAVKRACKRILELEKDKESSSARFARRELLAYQLEPGVDFASSKTDTLLEKFRAFLASPNATEEDAELALDLADFLGEHPAPRAIKWSERIGALLAPNADPELAQAGRILQGTARRLSLAGHPMKLTGTAIDGKPFDLAALKGKTVLVFFWTTTGDYCLDEISNLKNNYEGFKAKGFEVVGICVDDDRGDVADFLKEEEIPWTTLYDKDGRHPAMDEYGIHSLPATVLIGKDGKVAALDVRAEALGEKLKALLGAPAEVKGAPGTDPHVKENIRKKEESRKKAPKATDEDAETPAEKLRRRYTF